jgi:glycyl-tRNA synthetase
MQNPDLMEKIVSLCKRRGFIFQSSEIYGGLSNAWDYGPLGVELKNNLKRAWWEAIIHYRDDVFGLDTAILMHPKTWQASGHADHFSDPFAKCPSCKKYFRLDKVWDELKESKWVVSFWTAMEGSKDSSQIISWAKKHGKTYAPNLALVKEPEVTLSWIVDSLQSWGALKSDFKGLISRLASSADGRPQMPCPNCGESLPPEGVPANLMLKTYLGPVEETADRVYLRPETAQGIFVNFKNVIDCMHRRLPFGVAQIGKSFRNEITPGNFTFRTREFEQMEIEYFIHPSQAEEYYQKWIQDRHQWYLDLGVTKDDLRLRPHGQDELAHYAKGCTDIEYHFPFGWSELEGIANRSDFDLKQHSQFSGVDLQYHDSLTNEKYFPYIIEPSGGVDRALLAFLVDAYHEEEVQGKTRIVLKLHKKLSPIKVAILPLLKNNDAIVQLAKSLKKDLQKDFVCVYNDTAAIGKLYRRQDEIGTLFCITVDVQSLEDQKVTVRHRDTMAQDRISIDQLKQYLRDQFVNS